MHDLRRQQLRHFLRLAQQLQHLITELAQRRLLNAFGGRIHRRQCSLHRRLGRLHNAILRVGHFLAQPGQTHFTITTHNGTGLKMVFLTGGKMEETQMDLAGAVFNSANQAAAFANHHIRHQHTPLNQHLTAITGGTNGHQARAILIPKR